ncbi:MAG TPA: adenine deaminase [Methylomirabilota bacterium]|nr:adenine deaminase [Methylomirabilota bacterium]
MSYEEMVRTALGDAPFDLLLKNVKLVNVYTREIYDTNIGIHDRIISYVGGSHNFKSKDIFDANGMYAIPGLIDSHLHIESSMVTPPRFAEAVLPHGTTTVAVDPHEIGNVLGKAGVRMMLDTSEDLPLKIFVLAPTCVPAVLNADTAGAEIDAADVSEMLGWDRVIGLAEVMDYYGVITLDKRMTSIVKTGRESNVVIDGHCMGLSEEETNAYASTGIEANHEYFPIDTEHDYKADFEIVRREMRLGMFAKLRKFSLTPGLVRLLATLPSKQNLLFVTDDVMPDDLIRDGHLDDVVRTAIQGGFDPIDAVRSATYFPAKHLRLFDRGAIAPGKLADILLLKDLNEFNVTVVLANGKMIAKNGKLLNEINLRRFPEVAKRTVKLEKMTHDTFRVHVKQEHGTIRVRVITLQPGFLSSFEERDAIVTSHIAQTNYATVAVLERHGRTKNKAIGFIDKFGLDQGAIASTVSHDSHNLIVIGMNAIDMAVAANALIECQGGLAAASGGEVLTKVELPVAGLMSEEETETVARKLSNFRRTEEQLGLTDRGTMLLVVTIALPVISHARITDKGLFDVDRQEIVPLVVE